MNDEAVMNILLAGIYVGQAFMDAAKIKDDARQMRAEGKSWEEVSVYLQKLADDRLAELNAVEVVKPTP